MSIRILHQHREEDGVHRPSSSTPDPGVRGLRNLQDPACGLPTVGLGDSFASTTSVRQTRSYSAQIFSACCGAVRFHLRGVDHLRVGRSSIPSKPPTKRGSSASSRTPKRIRLLWNQDCLVAAAKLMSLDPSRRAIHRVGNHG